jgi:hypothetical protein
MTGVCGLYYLGGYATLPAGQLEGSPNLIGSPLNKGILIIVLY